MIVVDVGCHPHPPEESVGRLIDEFKPDLLLGFDPHPDLREGVTHADGTCVVRRRAAVWVETMSIPFLLDGIRSRVLHDTLNARESVHAVDVRSILDVLPGPVILKLDCEGSEYPILDVLRRYDYDLHRLARVLVEWHDEPDEQGFVSDWVADRPDLRCPVEEW